MAKTRAEIFAAAQKGIDDARAELLEAMEGVVAVADRKTVEFDKARAAIAKAKGGIA